MLKKLVGASLLLLLSAGLFAMEEQQGPGSLHKESEMEKDKKDDESALRLPKTEILPKEFWMTREPNAAGLEKHTKYDCPGINRIIIGHSASENKGPLTKEKIKGLLQNVQDFHMDTKKWATIGCTICSAPVNEMDDPKSGQYCAFRGRDDDIVPVILKGFNVGTCAVMLLGSFDLEKVTPADMEKWAVLFGDLAFRYKFANLEIGKNIFGMSQLSEIYNLSPGKSFMDNFVAIVARANMHLDLLRRQQR